MMFAKPYKIKSNTTLKNTEKKHLAQRIQDVFPLATEEKTKEIVSVKSTCICMRLVLNSGEIVGVYVVDGVPMMIETEQSLLPTVCALWQVPDLVPTITVHTPVLSKVQGGAPLYLPGVTLPAGGAGFPVFQRGTVMSACTSDNAAACIVGRAAISSADMLLRASGVCMDILHVYGDLLCKDPKFSKIERPKLNAASVGDIGDYLAAHVNQLSIQPPVKEEWPSLGKRVVQATPSAPVPNEPRLIPDNNIQQNDANGNDDTLSDETMLTENSQTEDGIPTDMDGLLQWCLLSFLKLEGKSVELPLKTNLLYRNHLMPLCPPDRTLDVKKSSYKKMGKFLEAMQKEGLVEVRELEKGVDAVVAVQPAHPLVRGHAPGLTSASAPGPGPASASAPALGPGEYRPPLVRELYCVTAAVAPLCQPHKKGTALSPPEVRAIITEYVKARNLNSTGVKGAVTLDATLASILGKREQENVKWDALMSGVLNKMTPSTEMRYADGTVKLTKTKLEPIKMQVASRSGNKKVTLVSNLEAFGFSLSSLAHVCQVGVAASCGVTRSPAARADQLMLQGDQTHFVAKLLIEKYGLPKKFVDDADKALNKKKP